MIGVTAYVAWSAKRRKHLPTWKKWGPTILTAVAGVLILADLVRHVLQDTNVWPADKGSAQYRPDCGKEDIACLSTVGVFFTIIFTYSGFILLALGTLWNANIMAKLKEIKKQWRELRK